MPTILVIEDNQSDRYLIKLAITRARIRAHIIFANDGKEAVQYIDTHAPVDLVITDINLPFYSGVDVVGHIRTGNWRNVCVIIMSSLESPDAKEQIEKLTPFFFLKPLDLDGFLKLGDYANSILPCKTLETGYELAAAR